MKQFESVKLEKEVVDKVRSHVTQTRQTLAGFFTLSAEERLSGGIIGKIKNDPDIYRAWKDNIAMAVKDEFYHFKKKKKHVSLADMHIIANAAAKYFLDSLFNK